MQCLIDMTFDPTYPHPPDIVDLGAICNGAGWILADVLAALIAAGVPDVHPDHDPEAFAHHCFAIHANGPGYEPTKKLSERQHNILTCI